MITIYVNEDFQLSSIIRGEIAATIGFFDGVHNGHRFLIRQLKDMAAALGLPAAVITFPVHPRKVLHSDYQPELLNSFEEKMTQLATTGIDYCIVLDFTPKVAGLSAEIFIQDKLSEQLHVSALLVGYDHKFGQGRTDGFEQYKVYGEACNMQVFQAVSLSEKDFHVSSTTIRSLLAEGRVREASAILSYPYTLEGIVMEGNRMGRELGFPTANINLPEMGKIIPRQGIYATRVYVDGRVYQGMTYIGKRPSLFDMGELRIETNLLDFEGDLYGKTIRIEFIDYIRDDMKFDSVEGLKKRLQEDREETRLYLKGI